jgi:Zn-dependent protease with chaperone function
MDFFAAQDSARTRSRTLVALFVLAVAAIIAAVYTLVHALVTPGYGQPVDPMTLLAVSGGIILLVTIGSAMRTSQLRRGGAAVAEMLGGRRVLPGSGDELERRLINVVEEMAIASGTPVPAIFVLDNEPGINAFAAGYTLDDAAVAVTRGALETLSRDELQGVVAHEFSHILNGDMRLNIRLIGLLFGILLLAVVGRGLLRGGAMSGRGGRRGRGGGGGAQVAAIGFGLIAVGYIGVFFGRLIQAAVSRQREYLADSAAVQFTRDPTGIAGALRKIGAAATGSRIHDHHAAEASHLFFANGISRPFATLMATHPPLPDRIRRLEAGGPGSAGEGSAPAAAASRVPGAAGAASFAGAAAGVGSGAASRRPPAAVSSADTGPGAAGATLMADIGAPRAEHVAYAHRLLASLPAEVLAAAHDAEGAQALLFALLRSGDAAALRIQEHAVHSLGGNEAVQRATQLATLIEPLGAAVRLPLLDILLPALRTLPAEARRQLRSTAEALVKADGRVDMFELAVLHVLGRQLAEGRNAAAAADAVHSLQSVRAELELVLSAVVWSGAHEEAAAQAAFAEAAGTLPQVRGLTIRPRGDIEVGTIDRALARLRSGIPAIRRRVLDACAHAVAHDGQVRIQEAELLRAVSEALDCPMPPALVAPPAAVSSR